MGANLLAVSIKGRYSGSSYSVHIGHHTLFIAASLPWSYGEQLLSNLIHLGARNLTQYESPHRKARQRGKKNMCHRHFITSLARMFPSVSHTANLKIGKTTSMMDCQAM
jgi:hypothetical protein